MGTGLYKEHPLIDCNLGPGSPVLSTDLLLGAIDPYTPLSSDHVYNASHLYRLHISHINTVMLNLEHFPLHMSYLTSAERVYMKCTARYCRDLVKGAKKLYNPKNHSLFKLSEFGHDSNILLRNLDSMGLWLVCLLDVLEREKRFQETLHSNLNRHIASPSLRFLISAIRSTELSLGYFTALFRHELGASRYLSMAISFRMPTNLNFSRITVPWRNFTPNDSFKTVDFGPTGSWNSVLQSLIESHNEANNPRTRHMTVAIRRTPVIHNDMPEVNSSIPANRNIEL